MARAFPYNILHAMSITKDAVKLEALSKMLKYPEIKLPIIPKKSGQKQ